MEETKQKKPSSGYFKSLCKYFTERNKKHIFFAVLMALYAAFCIGALIYFAVIGRGRDCLISVAYLAIVPIFYLAEFNLKIRSPLPYTIFVLVFCAFCFLGASFNFYTLIPMLDDILHACWGVLFSTLGFCVIKSLMGEPKTVKQFAAYLLFSIGFCMLLSVLWEIYEFTCDNLMHNFDMQEDTIIHHFHSFMLYPGYDHLHTFEVDGIVHTVIYGENGKVLLELDGYLDIGLYDTMWDLIWCVVSTCALCLVLAIDRKLGGKLYPRIIPVYIGKEGDAKAAEEMSESGRDEAVTVNAEAEQLTIDGQAYDKVE